MRIDPRLLEMQAKYAKARDDYDEYRKQFAHAPTWPMLSTEKQNEWYRIRISNVS